MWSVSCFVLCCYDDMMPNKLPYYTFRYYAITVLPYLF